MSLFHLLTLHTLVSLVGLLIYVTTSHVQRQRRVPSSAMAWVLFIIFLPYIGLPLYLTFGTRKLPHANRDSRPVAPVPPNSSPDACSLRLAAALGQPAPVPYTALNLHAHHASALQALMATIDGAQQRLDLCTFILGNDTLGRQVTDKLIARARNGVQVRLLLDGVGSWLGGHADLRPLRQAGVQVGLFVPPIHSPRKGRTNMRNHRKLVIADADTADARLWAGGRNLAAEYFGLGQHLPPWQDLSFDLQGGLANQAAVLFERDWQFAMSDSGLPPPMPDANLPTTDTPSPKAQIIASGPDQPDDTIYCMLLSAIHQARKRIALASPYVVLDNALQMGLVLAAKRGVRIDLLLPAHSNHKLADIARHRSLRSLADAGARIWMAPTMLHAKAALFDDTLAMVGSSNLDSRSLFLNYELMVCFNASPDVERFMEWFDRERETASPYQSVPPGLWQDVGEGLVLWVGFQL